jgi:UDP-GlcNAc:undecaprenyl-phosphate GlcNAc-1-phosphate transferase
MFSSPVFLTVLVFCLSALLVFDFIWLLVKTPVVYFFIDKPGIRKIHQRTIPRAGGFCIAVSFFGMLCLWDLFSPDGFPQISSFFFNICMVVTVGIVTIGFFDDTRSFVILNRAKFLLEFLIAAEVVFVFGIQFPELNFFGLIVIKNQLLLSVFSIFWMVGVANALNIIDGIDGLAGTFAVISFVTIAILALHAHVADVAVLCVIIAGCLVGFLFHNVSPARVFLGDTGSLLLGMLLSLFLMFMVSQPKDPFSINTAFLIAGYPILDVAVAMGRRFFRARLVGKGWVQSFRATTVADSEHMHHRLVYRGLSHTQATLVIATLSSALCVTAIYINLFSEFKYALLVYMGVVIFWFLYELNFFDRFILYIKFVLKQDAGKQMYRIGVVDADPILHHALIHFRQRKFRFEFFSHQDLENRDAVRELQLQSLPDAHKQFSVSETWTSDTRKISRDIIHAVLGEIATKSRVAGQVRKEPPVRSGPPAKQSVNNKPHLAMLINCRDVDDLDEKKLLGLRLLQEMLCAVIIVTEQLPDPNSFSNELMRQIIFVKKPFYVPVFFKELYQMARQWNEWGNAGIMLKDTKIMKTIAR